MYPKKGGGEEKKERRAYKVLVLHLCLLSYYGVLNGGNKIIRCTFFFSFST
jgi:hypothetical protein